MNIYPTTLSSHLIQTTASTDFRPPLSSLVYPLQSDLEDTFCNSLFLLFEAIDHEGVVAGFEVSLDSGSSWHPTKRSLVDADHLIKNQIHLPTPHVSSKLTYWSYSTAQFHTPCQDVVVNFRAIDDSLNLEPVHTVLLSPRRSNPISEKSKSKQDL